jgi:hypothetical protein
VENGYAVHHPGGFIQIPDDWKWEKRDALTGAMRKIKRAYLDADPLDKVTPEILLNFGLPPKDTTRTDAPDPTEVVPFTLGAASICKSS